MGTEVALSFSTLRAQLESEKSSLCKIDENIKKIVQTSGRFPSDRFNNASGDYSRGGGGGRIGGRNSFPEAGKNEDLFGKRKHETKTVFSRLSARAGDSDGDDDSDTGGGGVKRARMPSAVSRELPTRAAVLRAQGGDEQARTRNRRIFGSLLGTLQKFKQEEIVLQTKEEKKAQVERKIEEQARQQKEKEQKERKTLFQERDQRKATIKAIEAKMGRVQEFEKWEASQKSLANFILTKSKPHIYWLPKKMSDKATEKLSSSRKFHEKYMISKREELQDELQRIEQRCLRRGPAAKENDPAQNDKQNDPEIDDPDVTMKTEPDDDEKNKTRNKFAMDGDEKEKEDSDGEEKEENHKLHEDTANDATNADHMENGPDENQKDTTEPSITDDTNQDESNIQKEEPPSESMETNKEPEPAPQETNNVEPTDENQHS